MSRIARAAALAALSCGIAASPSHARPPDSPRLELRDGDRVVFLGDALLERDHEGGYLETELTSLWPDRDVTFRNLGRAGDTVWGDAWAGFDTAAEGFARRRDLVLGLRPTVVVVAYGMNESFAGEAGLARFVDGLGSLLDSLAPSGARVALVSPVAHERLPPPLPDPAGHNASLRLYRDAMARLARERGLVFVDLIRHRIGDGTRPERVASCPETDDGIHLNAFGYWQAAALLGEAIRPRSYPLWSAHVVARGEPIEGGHNLAPITAIERTPRGVRFRSLDERLPDLGAPPGVPDALATEGRTLKVEGLEPGRYTLEVDGRPFATASHEAWDRGVPLRDGPERRQAEALRAAIVEKNRLLYYRWRPQNETYLYGFRKHEQGQNAAEIPRFDPLVAEKEAEIARLRKPTPHVYELVRDAEDAR